MPVMFKACYTIFDKILKAVLLSLLLFLNPRAGTNWEF